jgi:hypothetical protein
MMTAPLKVKMIGSPPAKRGRAMTKADALIELREKVAAGLDTAHHHAAAFPSESAYGHCTWHDSHRASTRGSLDAAKALHDAMLPGWRARIDIGRRYRAWVISPENQKNDNYADTPARAWLLASLDALIEQEKSDC